MLQACDQTTFLLLKELDSSLPGDVGRNGVRESPISGHTQGCGAGLHTGDDLRVIWVEERSTRRCCCEPPLASNNFLYWQIEYYNGSFLFLWTSDLSERSLITWQVLAADQMVSSDMKMLATFCGHFEGFLATVHGTSGTQKDGKSLETTTIEGITVSMELKTEWLVNRASMNPS